MDWLVPTALAYCALPLLVFRFFCHCALLPFEWHWGAVYAALSFGLHSLEPLGFLTGAPLALLSVVLLAGYGLLLARQEKIRVFAAAALALSVASVLDGVNNSLSYFALSLFGPDPLQILRWLDTLRHVSTLLLFYLASRRILRIHDENTRPPQTSALALLAIPALFVSLVEKALTSAIYGNVIIWNSDTGLVYPYVNHFDMLLFQIAACLALFAALAAYRKLANEVQNEQTIQFLRQQSHAQEIYVREAQARYKETRSFRHDIQNHLLVVKELLRDSKTQEAALYIDDLEPSVSRLSPPCQTGVAAVDALLGSKLASASGQGIDADARLKLPVPSRVGDLDWCIVLANAVDNAIQGNACVPHGRKYLRVSGRQKGNFYLLCVENRCAHMDAPPVEGTGLANIRAVAQKYNGTVEIGITEDNFILNVMLIISHP